MLKHFRSCILAGVEQLCLLAKLWLAACCVLGADETTGLHLIEACNGDVAMAIGMHMDTIGTAASVSNTEQNTNQDLSTAHSSLSESSNSSQL